MSNGTVLDEHDDADGIDRRGFLKCMAWAGTGVVWTLSAGILSSCTLSQASNTTLGDFSFVQVSDSHIGFKNVPNMDVTSTFQKSIDRVGALPNRPSFLLHTGDVSHTSMPALSVHTTPVPAQAMHLRNPRRSIPSAWLGSSRTV